MSHLADNTPVTLLQIRVNKWLLSNNPLKKSLAWKILADKAYGSRIYLFIYPVLKDLKKGVIKRYVYLSVLVWIETVLSK